MSDGMTDGHKMYRSHTGIDDRPDGPELCAMCNRHHRGACRSSLAAKTDVTTEGPCLACADKEKGDEIREALEKMTDVLEVVKAETENGYYLDWFSWAMINQELARARKVLGRDDGH